jgi:hypothetical protein
LKWQNATAVDNSCAADADSLNLKPIEVSGLALIAGTRALRLAWISN